MTKPLSVTHHEIQLNGKTLKYTATAAQLPIMNASGEVEAHMFYVAYTLDDVPNAAKRPLTFAFNGGPGSASVWVHMGAMGPKRAKLMDNGDMPPPPYTLVDNDQTWLDKTDLVFIDAIGTGYSRAKTRRTRPQVQQHVRATSRPSANSSASISPAIRAGSRPCSSRAKATAPSAPPASPGQLIDQGIAFNGVILISTILNFEADRGTLANGLRLCPQPAHLHRRRLVSQAPPARPAKRI